MFADYRTNNSLGSVHPHSREELYDRIRRWHDLLPVDFDVHSRPAPHIILLKYVNISPPVSSLFLPPS
jgi:hypothetical protein